MALLALGLDYVTSLKREARVKLPRALAAYVAMADGNGKSTKAGFS
jgi:hypothetical protein